jgi:diacylglycerol kinase (ATP)
MKQALFIINPKAGKQGRNLQIFQELNVNFGDCIFTEYAEHATILTKKAIQDGYKFIIAVGGDGTVNEISTALLHTNCALGIVPMGSGNGLARELRFSMNLENCILQIKNAIETQSINLIDAGVLNFGSEKKYFFCTAGIGFDAHCAGIFAQKNSKKLKKRTTQLH